MNITPQDPAAAAGERPGGLTDLFGFALYSTSLAMTRLYRGLLQEVGLTYPQYLVMLVLWRQDGLRVSDIGDQLFLNSATLTPLLKRLEAMGMVSRTRATDDERTVVITLTAAGRALRERVAEVPAQVAAASVSTEEMSELRQRLVRLRARLLDSP